MSESRDIDGWPDLSEADVVRLYVEEDPERQREIGAELGLCRAAFEWITEDHSETDAHFSYDCRRRRMLRNKNQNSEASLVLLKLLP